MTREDQAALAAAGLQRWAEGQLRDVWALALVASRVAGAVSRAALDGGVPYASRTLDEAVEVLRRELRR